MTTQDSNSGRRECLGFAEAVAQHIAPLLTAKGFSCTEQTAYAVKFRSSDVALAVFHDPFSYEIDLVYSLQSAPSARYNLHNMLDTLLGPGHRQQAFFQASERDRVGACIKAIAKHLRKYGEKVLTGDQTTYLRIGEAARRHNETYTKQVVQRPIHEAAEDAWRKHDYAKVRDLYETIEDDLTPIERRRFDYARNMGTPT